MNGASAPQTLQRLAQLRPLGHLLPPGTAFLTGGSVRDALLGLPVKELDIAVFGDAARLGEQLAQKFSGKCFPLGREPRVTYRVVAPVGRVDLWPLTGSVEQDILRRDYSVNALFYQIPDGPLIDLVGGLADLAAGRLRVFRRENLLQDPLRVLRGLRLELTRPLRLTTESERVLAQYAAHLPKVTAERIREELEKMLLHASLVRLWKRGMELGIWPALGLARAEDRLPDADSLTRWEQLRLRRGLWGEATRRALWLSLALGRLKPTGDPHTTLADLFPALGVRGRELQRLARFVHLGEGLLRAEEVKGFLALHPPQREVLIWWFTRNPHATWTQVQRLWRWWTRFHRRPPLLSSSEVVALLQLPPGPPRAEVIHRLRQLQATGKLRTAGAARRYLLRWPTHQAR
ncbi:MAG: hypothetical protein N2447_05505 [Thermoanaerobaculum sp.]|nr:hypothetical protein [Thermoanaerobaculum sp.]